MHTCPTTFPTSLHTWHHLLHWAQHLIIVRHYFNHSHSSCWINAFVILKLWADLISTMDFSLMQGSILLCYFNTLWGISTNFKEIWWYCQWQQHPLANCNRNSKSSLFPLEYISYLYRLLGFNLNSNWLGPKPNYWIHK